MTTSAKYVTHEIVGVMILVFGVFSIFMIRMIGALDSIQYDLRYLADKERSLMADINRQREEEEKK